MERGVGRREDIQDEYFKWMTEIVCEGRNDRRKSWERLFRLLHNTEFVYILEMDANRADDGLELRYRFLYETGRKTSQEENALMERPWCSIFEMMVALAIRCEEYVSDDPESGNTAGKWFFEMIRSLGLGDMHDAGYREGTALNILTRFLKRTYKPNGHGGLFTIKNPNRDMRDAEIWYQTMWYLTEKIYERRNG